MLLCPAGTPVIRCINCNVLFQVFMAALVHTSYLILEELPVRLSARCSVWTLLLGIGGVLQRNGLVKQAECVRDC